MNTIRQEEAATRAYYVLVETMTVRWMVSGRILIWQIRLLTRWLSRDPNVDPEQFAKQLHYLVRSIRRMTNRLRALASYESERKQRSRRSSLSRTGVVSRQIIMDEMFAHILESQIAILANQEERNLRQLAKAWDRFGVAVRLLADHHRSLTSSRA